MRQIRFKVFKLRILPLLVTGILIFIGGIGSAAGYEFIDISNPFMKKAPLAIPYFKALGGTEDEVKLTNPMADLLSKTLEFSSLFKIVDRGAFLEDPVKKGITLKDIENSLADTTSYVEESLQQLYAQLGILPGSQMEISFGYDGSIVVNGKSQEAEELANLINADDEFQIQLEKCPRIHRFWKPLKNTWNLLQPTKKTR